MTAPVKETRPSLPEGWRRVRLGDICRVVSGSTPSTNVPGYWDGDIVWITPTDLGRLTSRRIDASSRRITVQGYQNCGTELVPVGSVILSSRAPIGHLGIAAVSLCTNQGCKSFVAGAEVDSDFLYFALKQGVKALKALGSGATFAEVSKSQLENFQITMPPLPEQRRIAADLHDQMAAVERARVAAEAQLGAAEKLPAAYLREVFGSMQHKGLPKRRLGEILQLRKEVIHPGDNAKGRTTFVGLEHIESTTGIRTGFADVEMAELTGRKPKFYQSDIVYGYLRPYLNKVWVAEFDGLCSVDQYVYSVTPELANVEYVAWFMRSPTYLERAPINTTPGQLPRIRIDEVASVEIELPPLNQQETIVADLNRRFAAINKTYLALQELHESMNELPQALLQEAFSAAI